MEEPYRPFKLSKKRQERVDKRDEIIKFGRNRDIARRFVKELQAKATPAELILLQELLTANPVNYRTSTRPSRRKCSPR